MNAKQLIEENNKKREQLSKENEEYYSDMLIYIRSQLTLSEQQSEEILMEMLDHLLEGQKEGKSAWDIFGDDPQAYADEIIELLPKEEKRKIVPFIGGIIGHIVTWLLIIRGVLFLILEQFMEVNQSIYLFGTLLMSVVIALFVIFVIWYIFRVIKQSLFSRKRNSVKDSLKVGLIAAIGMAIVLLMVKITPDIGPSIELNGWISLLIGVLLWGIMFITKKWRSS